MSAQTGWWRHGCDQVFNHHAFRWRSLAGQSDSVQRAELASEILEQESRVQGLDRPLPTDLGMIIISSTDSSAGDRARC